LIGVVILPPAKIPNVLGAPNIRQLNLPPKRPMQQRLKQMLTLPRRLPLLGAETH
jgi:hypothetical protein